MKFLTQCLLALLFCIFTSTSALAVETTPPETGEDRGGLTVPAGSARLANNGLVEPGTSGKTPEVVPRSSTAPGSLLVALPDGPQGASTVVRIFLLITILAVAPGALMMMTSFTRIIIVLGFLRRAIGTQTLPPNQVLLGLSLFLTLFIMAPTIKTVHKDAWEPLQRQEINEEVAMERTMGAMKSFMIKHTRKNDLALFIRLAKEERPKTIDDVSMLTLIPAFATSELKTAFQMGFVLFLPFVVIDLVISSVLMALGMMMLPPVMISLPFKILLFVLVDGWTLLIQGLAASYA